MRRSFRRAAGFAFAASLAAVAPAPAEDDAAPLVVADFESGDKSLKLVKASLGSIEIVDASPGEGHALHWKVEPAAGGVPYVHIFLKTPPDLVKYGAVQFRIRLDGPRPGPLFLRLESGTGGAGGTGGTIGARVRGVSSEWKTMALDIGAMETTGAFDPTAARILAFAVNGSTGGVYVVDDVTLLASMPAPAAKDPPAGDAKGAAARVPVADFEAEESIEFVDPLGAKVQRAPAGAKEKGFVLACSAEAVGKQSNVRVFGVPADVRQCGTLRFRVRATKPVKQTLVVRLEDDVDDFLGGKASGISTQWKTVELRLPEMVESPDFDPRRVQAVSFTFGEAPDAVVQIDDVELEKSAGGWRSSEAERLARVFGDARAKKVVKTQTQHFDVFTDSAAADDKLPAALEEKYDFVRKAIGLREMDERMPVYILENSTLYQEFLVRFAGSPKSVAEVSHGRGTPRYFATYYQSADAPVIVHELTHALFQKTVGVFGGNWFHEGMAVYAEHLWRKESAAELFSAELRSGQFVHLADFMKMPKLITERDVKGGPRTAEHLYDQAGAFYEFLVRGPMADKAPTLIATLGRTRSQVEEEPARVTAVLGVSLDDIEKAWIAWGSEPPKSK